MSKQPRSVSDVEAANQSREKLRLLNDLVAVRRKDAESVTPGGIVLPENAKQKATKGEVIAVGPGSRHSASALDCDAIKPLSVNVTDIVIFQQYAGHEVELNGETLLLLREDDILGVVE